MPVTEHCVHCVTVVLWAQNGNNPKLDCCQPHYSGRSKLLGPHSVSVQREGRSWRKRTTVTSLQTATKLEVVAPQAVRRLSGALPVFIEASDWEATAEELDDIFLGDAGQLPLPISWR